jgi:PAS domain S-box-containing protein
MKPGIIDPAADEVKRLNACIGDLTTILALPAIWIGSEPSQIVSSLLDALLRTLRLDFAYARLGGWDDEPPSEMVRAAQRQGRKLPAQDVGRALDPWLTPDAPVGSLGIPNPVGEGTVSIARFRLGLPDDAGILVVGSARADFPSKTDMLLLRVAVNQAVIGLQEARLLGTQQRAAAELERRIVERTSQLTIANESLQDEVFQRRRAQDESLVLKDELAEELAAMTRLHQFTTRILATPDLASVLQDVLSECIELQNADFGNVQLFNPATGALEIAAQKGFREDFLTHFKSVCEPDSACGRALQQGSRVIIEDVLTDEGFAPHRAIAASAGFRAVQSTPIFSRRGKPLGMISTHFRQRRRPLDRELRFTDLYAHLAGELIERQQSEQALRESEERFRRYFELGLIGMAMTSPTKRILEVNDELCRMLGYERYELLKKNWAELTHPDDLAAEVAQFNRVLAGDFDGYTLEKRWIRKDGQMIDSIRSAKCLRNADGSVKYFVGLVEDITERKRAEEALRATQAQLAHIARVTTMGELAASIAHEVNQPLTAVVTNGDAGLRWLSQLPPNVDEARIAMKEMARQGHRASDVIARIRALLRKTPPQFSDVGLNQLIVEVLLLTHRQLAGNGVAVRTELAADIPPVSGDPIQLQQVLVNLILNAIEAATGTKDGARELLLTTQRAGTNDVVVAVQDSGAGIDPQHMDRLFRPFFTTKATGMGMGLAISRSIIEAHGGRLWATSNGSHGATFQFSLPVQSAE